MSGVESPSASLPPECDYCEQALWDDEGLTPIYVGPPGETSFEGAARRPPNEPAHQYRYHGRRVTVLSAVYEALNSAPNVEIDNGEKVEVVGEYRPRYVFDYGDVEYGDVRLHDNDEVGVRVRITPERGEPDMWVCEHCAEEFSQ